MMEEVCTGCDAGLGRREFLSKTVLAAASLALAACASDSMTAPTSVGGTVNIGDHAALANVNGVATVTVNGALLAIVRTGTDSFVALSRVCPHQGGRIDVNGAGFKCTKHGAEFTLTGTWKGGERTTNMRSYPITYDATANILTVG